MPVCIADIGGAVYIRAIEPLAGLLAASSGLVAPTKKIELHEWPDRNIELLYRRGDGHCRANRAAADEVLSFSEKCRSDGYLTIRTVGAFAQVD